MRTSGIVAEHLKKLGLEVETGIAKTGVVALLRTGKPGPTIALRADMDALPVTERTDVPFNSVAKSSYRGEEVGVMHACGHDSHTAILMGVAEALTKAKGSLRGNVLFVFQPAEEGAPPGEVGGASEMLKAGIFEKYKPEVAFGLHVWASLNTGIVGYRSGPFMAGSQAWKVVVNGKQTHGSRPWQGVDPDRRRGADHQRHADGRQPADRHHAESRRRVRGHHQGRRPQQHHPGLGRDHRHHPHLRSRSRSSRSTTP